MTGALNVSVDDSAQALTAASVGLTVPLIEPDLRLLNANNPAAANVTTASLIPVNFINSEFKNEKLGITDIQKHKSNLRIREGSYLYVDKDYAIIYLDTVEIFLQGGCCMNRVYIDVMSLYASVAKGFRGPLNF
jgi:hypothetical protein